MKNLIFTFIFTLIFSLSFTSCNKYDDFVPEVKKDTIAQVDTIKEQPKEYQYRLHITEEVTFDSLYYQYYYYTGESKYGEIEGSIFVSSYGKFYDWHSEKTEERIDTLSLGKNIKFNIDYYVDTLTITELDKYNITSIPNKNKAFDKKITLSSDHNINQNVLDCLILITDVYTFNYSYYISVPYSVYWDEYIEYDNNHSNILGTHPIIKRTYKWFYAKDLVNKFRKKEITPSLINIELSDISR